MTREFQVDLPWIFAAPLETWKLKKKLERSMLWKDETLPLFPGPYTFTFFYMLLLHGFSWHPQRESLLTGYIHTSYAQNCNFSKWNERAGNLVAFLTTWPSFMKLRTWVLNVGPRQSAISSLTNLWAAESMRMILNSIDCKRTGNWGLLQSW